MPRPPFNNGTWSCASCGTSTTPVRRAGHSLCNACGLRRAKILHLARFPSGIAAPPGATATKPRRGRPRTKSRPGAFGFADEVLAPDQRRRPPPILVPHTSFAHFAKAMSPEPHGSPLSAHADSFAAQGHYGVSPLEICDATSPLSSASSLGQAPPEMGLSPSVAAVCAPSFGDIVDAMLSVTRLEASRPAVSDNSAEDDDRFLSPPAEEGADVEAVRENLEVLQKIMHDGGWSEAGFQEGAGRRQSVV